MAKNPSKTSGSAGPETSTAAAVDAPAGASRTDPAGADAADAGAGAPPPVTSIQTTSALVQVDVHIAGTAYPAGVVLEGLPAATADAYRGSVDPHPDAVAHSIAAGAKVLQFAVAEAD